MSNPDSLKLSAENFDAIDQIVNKYNSDKGAAIMILQQVQATYGYIGQSMLERISQLTGTPTSELFSIVTFYSQFRLEPLGENFIQVCHGTACHLAGAERISEAVQHVTKAKPGHTSPDGKFTLEHVACLGCCSHGPIMTLNNETFARMTPDKVKKMLHQKVADKGFVNSEGCELSE
ncbi:MULTISPECIES: NADH-quinone oxidoreductase subunit NuoE [Eubacteriales]|uniref:NADH dehydrogenase subunit E n=1 Tax=Desulforamulus putei DSM 12395 TaxID=1121429 RepID=A0A1M4VB78_9FIRM|nr:MULTISPECIES: NADH-quinone oxidoreductase subunit NuoE [Eubacteriales]SHE66219.1 NADH dehydrogenase subunit E [Desulforamulus putei DSM 12395]